MKDVPATYPSVLAHIADYLALVKPRLSFLVVFSSSMAYLWACNRLVDAVTIWLLSVGGFLVTGCANCINQIIEKDSDGLMKRTANRPLVNQRIQIKEAVFFAFVLGLSGLFLLYRVNSTCAALGLLAVILYGAAYTPLKKYTSLTVIPGAIAGSLPVVIGCVAAEGKITGAALLLFSLQFIWQFPHTWSIAWLLNDEYNKAGIKLLPGGAKKNAAALLIMASTFLIVPVGFLLYLYQLTGIAVTILLAAAGLAIFFFSLKHFRRQTDRSAVGLMFSSFVYLPLIMLILVLERFFG